MTPRQSQAHELQNQGLKLAKIGHQMGISLSAVSYLLKGHRTDKYKQYQKSDKYKQYHKQYQKSDKYKQYQKQYYLKNRETILAKLRTKNLNE